MPPEPGIVDDVRAVLQEHLGVSRELAALRAEVAGMSAALRELLDLQRRETTAREAEVALVLARAAEDRESLDARDRSIKRWAVSLGGAGGLVAGAIMALREIILAIRGGP